METLTEDRTRPAEAVRPADGTGQRVSLRRLFWIFFIASFLGANIETAFMLLTRGELQNRSGVLFGTFSLVWGFGAVLFTLCFRRFQGRGRGAGQDPAQGVRVCPDAAGQAAQDGSVL